MKQVDVDQESRLIEAVRERKTLYDKRVDGYRKNKDLTWKEVAEQLNYGDLKGDDWQKIWTNLRGQYMAHRRKLKKPSGSGTTGKRAYFRHEDAMRFINDTPGEEETYSNLNLSGDNSEHHEESIDESPNGNNSLENEVPRPVESDHRSHSKFSGKRKLDPFDESLINILKSDDKDEYSVLGDLVAVKLRKIAEKDKRLAVATQQSITTLVHDAEMELL